MQEKTFFIKPAFGIKIADPETREYLPDAGAIKPRSGFWIRRLKDKDVIECKDLEERKDFSNLGQEKQKKNKE